MHKHIVDEQNKNTHFHSNQHVLKHELLMTSFWWHEASELLFLVCWTESVFDTKRSWSQHLSPDESAAAPVCCLLSFIHQSDWKTISSYVLAILINEVYFYYLTSVPLPTYKSKLEQNLTLVFDILKPKSTKLALQLVTGHQLAIHHSRFKVVTASKQCSRLLLFNVLPFRSLLKTHCLCLQFYV